MTDEAFQCPYAPKGRRRCFEAICDCFIDVFAEDPFGIHPEAFVVGRAEDSE